MTQHDPMKVAFVIGFATALASAAVQFTIQRDVNSALPKDQRISYWRSGRDWGWRERLFRAHRDFYPDSELRTLYWVLCGLTMLSGAFIFLQGVTASR